ncbi:MAG: hypothetical protein Q7S61_02990 [bacterium]|nr:hypothetical protein [bacterium]
MAENGKGFGIEEVPGVFKRTLYYSSEFKPGTNGHCPFTKSVLVIRTTDNRETPITHYLFPVNSFPNLSSNGEIIIQNGNPAAQGKVDFTCQANDEEGVDVLWYQGSNGQPIKKIKVGGKGNRPSETLDSDGNKMSWKIHICNDVGTLNGFLIMNKYNIVFDSPNNRPFTG